MRNCIIEYGKDGYGVDYWRLPIECEICEDIDATPPIIVKTEFYYVNKLGLSCAVPSSSLVRSCS